MKKTRILLSVIFALIGWFAVIGQFILMLQNLVEPVGESVIRFFSYFTILTNTMLALYFTIVSIRGLRGRDMDMQPGLLTAITVYILIVGLVYQFLLRQLWSPAGMHKLVDELLHSVTPLLALVYWFLYEQKTAIRYRQLLSWLIYPLLYLIYILIRGRRSGFYPYPFVDVGNLGFQKVLLNAGILLILFATISALFIWLGRKFSSRN